MAGSGSGTEGAVPAVPVPVPVPAPNPSACYISPKSPFKAFSETIMRQTKILGKY